MLNFILSELFGKAKLHLSKSDIVIPEIATCDKDNETISSIRNVDDLSLGPLHAPDNDEKSDTYYRLVIQLNTTWRIILCKNGIQWILQKRKGSYNGKPAWRGRSYCRSKAGLCRTVRKHVPKVSPEADAQLAQLPDWVES